mgnify:CR=1 FL=1
MDHFDDDRRYRRPRDTTYVGSYRRPGTSRFFNPAGDILEGIEGSIEAIGKRKTKVRDFENAAAQRRQELADSLRDTEGMEDTDAMNSLQAELSKMVDEAYKLDIASFEGDRSAYNKKQSDLNKVLGDLPKLMGLIDAEGEAMKKAEESGVDYVKKILRNNNQEYVDFVQDASKGGKNIGFRIEGGNIIPQFGGKDAFNGSAFIKAKENGVDLVNYAEDYSEQMSAIDKKAAEGLNRYIPTTIIKKIENGEKLTETESKNYDEAKRIYTERLQDSDLLTPILNESTYQTYTDYNQDSDAWSNSNDQREATKQAMIYGPNGLLKRRFPGPGGEVVTQRKIDETYEKPALKSSSSSSSSSGDGDGGGVAGAVSYIDNKYEEISLATANNNQGAVEDIIKTEISNITGVDPQVEFDGDDLVITTSSSTGKKAYTKDQAKKINEAASSNGGSAVVNDDGIIIDQDAFDELSQVVTIGPPEGKAIQKPGKTTRIDDYKSEEGTSQLLNLLARNRYSTAKDKNLALDEVEKLRAKGNQRRLSGARNKAQKQAQQANILQLEKDAMQLSNLGAKDVIKNGQLNENQKQSPWLKQAINFVKKLPKDFVIDGPNGKVKAEDYFKGKDITTEDLMFNYATLYKQIVNDPSLAPGVSFTYTSISNADKLDQYNLND